MNCVCGRSDISEIIYLSILISNIKLHPKIALQYINCYCAGGELHPSHIFVQRLIALFLIQFQLNLAPWKQYFQSAAMRRMQNIITAGKMKGKCWEHQVPTYAVFPRCAVTGGDMRDTSL